MPIYEYECEVCKHQFELIQKFSDDPVKECPVCKGDVFTFTHSCKSTMSNSIVWRGIDDIIIDSYNLLKRNLVSGQLIFFTTMLMSIGPPVTT